MAEPILGASLEELRRTRTSVKWRVFGPEVLPVWVAEMDSRQCPAVVEALTSALQRGDTGYAWPSEYAEAVAGFAQRRWGWSPDPATMASIPDVMIGIEELLHRHVPRESAVVVSPPVYDSFYGFIASVGRRLVTAPLNDEFRLDFEALERAFTDAGPGSAYLLCNPQNPTGTVHTAEELAQLARLADQHSILVISDEIHAPLVQPGTTYSPYLSVPEASRGVALVSGSKAWNLAGIKAALAVPGPEARQRLTDLHEVVTHGANHLGVLAQTVAYSDESGWLDQLLEEIAARRAYTEALLAERLPQIRVIPANATYLAWLDCRELGVDDPAKVFRERGKVALTSGFAYDPDGGAGWARLNIATSEEILDEAVRRMAAAVP
ncbi:MalY/PatB family protein [Demetria terragena]|uniref:MalY/PatB family protein n=1 Tax=Demetria terragena TaxID=63959 RepID=UPI00035CE558|nr:aminotransferase class I/II-fold pyridoxal phosphate-dependent enzyme [Demetria terragena]